MSLRAFPARFLASVHRFGGQNLETERVHPLEVLSAVEMMHVWGLRISGGSLKSPVRRGAGGGRCGEDDEMGLVYWIEQTPGFSHAYPVLIHKYSGAGSLSDYRYRFFDETIRMASRRHGQESLCRAMLIESYRLNRRLPRSGPALRDIELRLTKDVHRRFIRALMARKVDSPFRVPKRYEE